MRARIRSSFILLAALPALAAFAVPRAGAANPPAGTATIQGKVTFKGVPLPGGTIAFHPARGKAIRAPIQEDGSYEAKKVPVGKVKVTIETESLRPKPVPKAPGKPPALPPRPGKAGKYVPIPAKYADPITSGLTLDVKEGKMVHDIQLD